MVHVHKQSTGPDDYCECGECDECVGPWEVEAHYGDALEPWDMAAQRREAREAAERRLRPCIQCGEPLSDPERFRGEVCRACDEVSEVVAHPPPEQRPLFIKEDFVAFRIRVGDWVFRKEAPYPEPTIRSAKRSQPLISATLPGTCPVCKAKLCKGRRKFCSTSHADRYRQRQKRARRVGPTRPRGRPLKSGEPRARWMTVWLSPAFKDSIDKLGLSVADYAEIEAAVSRFIPAHSADSVVESSIISQGKLTLKLMQRFAKKRNAIAKEKAALL